ncbi:MAG: zinc-dependent alcohol dehydrogenase [Promethearchaeota archaeon]
MTDKPWKQTRGVFLRDYHKLEVVAGVDMEDLINGRSDMVVVEMGACGICGSDVNYWNGINPWSLHTKGTNDPIPDYAILGHEIAGTIVDVRRATSEERVGERVGIIAYKECGECVDCLNGRHNLCAHCLHLGHNGTWKGWKVVPGGFADYFPCWHEKCVELPDNVSFAEASQLDGLAVATHANNRTGVKMGDTVLVIGAGPIGYMASQIAKAYGAGRVITVDVADKPLAKVEKVGADVTVNSSKEDVVGVVMEETRGLGADAVIDTIGAAETVKYGLKSLKRGGVMGMLAGFAEEVNFHLNSFAAERILTSCANNLFPEYITAMDMLKAGKVDLKSMITHTFPLDEIEEAMLVASDHEEYDSLKVVIVPK